MKALSRLVACTVVTLLVTCPVMTAVAPAALAQTAKKKPAAKKRAAPAAPAVPVPAPPPERIDYSAAQAAAADIPGIPDARFLADSEQDFLRALPSAPGPWLILSTGGGDGAYGSGVLSGWSASGKRPDFTVVTGVSTGALMAPYAFVGAKYDQQLRDAYLNITSADVFEVGARGEALLDTWPLKDLIAKRVTPALLADIAAEHKRGRRLFVTTTDVDTERLVVWNMGAIAAQGGEKALALFRSVLLASASIPGVFPPVLIEVEADGRKFQEMHADGGLGAQFFIAPDSMMSATGTSRIPATELYIVLNGKLTPEFFVTERNMLSILGHAISGAIKIAARIALDRAYAAAKRSGVGFNVAYVDPNFPVVSKTAFDPKYMRALYDFGFEQGKNGNAFRSEPPVASAALRPGAQ